MYPKTELVSSPEGRRPQCIASSWPLQVRERATNVSQKAIRSLERLTDQNGSIFREDGLPLRSHEGSPRSGRKSAQLSRFRPGDYL